MSERREWWVMNGESNYSVAIKHGGSVEPDDTKEHWVHVREVLLGDEPLACQLGDANLELESVKQRYENLQNSFGLLKERNTKLVEAAKDVIENAFHDNETLGGFAKIDMGIFKNLQQVLEAEVGDV